MGRNAGTQIFWTHAVIPGTDTHVVTWYCQQHGKWDQISNTLFFPTAMGNLTDEISNVHGNVNQ